MPKLMVDDELPEEMLLGQFIPLHYHFNMLQDQTRMNAFREAIELVVPVGAKVLELGGGTGVLSYFAAQRAAQVWCVERNPALARAARQFLSNNPNGDRVQVIQADAFDYLPPEPVDVIICEMLHVALIREKQTEVLRSISDRYVTKFDSPLPAFLPDACVLSLQLIEQNFRFHEYEAPVPLFLPSHTHDGPSSLSELAVYSTICYDTEIPEYFHWEGNIAITRGGTLNAISFFTNNFLAYLYDKGQAIQWPMNRMVLPLQEATRVQIGDVVTIRVSYRAGCSIESLQDSLYVEIQSQSQSLQRAA